MKHSSAAGSVMLLAAALASPLCAAQAGPQAATTQAGAGNRAYVAQVNSGAEVTALVIQNGTNNVVGDPAGQSGGVQQSDAEVQVAEVRQTGNANCATLSQHGGWRAVTGLNQHGNDNVGAVRQDNVSSSVNRIAQAGAGNRVDGVTTDAGTSGFDAFQTGTGNRIAVVNRNTGYSGPGLTQNGEFNQIAAREEDVAYTTVNISQVGERNQVSATWTGTDSVQGTIDQDGADQAATVHSSAFGSGLRITQTGARNLATTEQRGRFQDATITQDGGNNRGAVVQH